VAFFLVHSIACHFLIGLPASGKSTLAQILAQESGGLIISTDRVRAQLYGDEAVQGVWQEIEKEVFSQVKGAIDQRQSVIYDATNANRLWRTGFLQQVADFGDLRWIGWYLDLPVEVCKQRNRERDRLVPESVIDSMAAELVQFPPDVSDGLAVCCRVPLLPDGQFDVDAIRQLCLQYCSG
jgi:predicted kinase